MHRRSHRRAPRGVVHSFKHVQVGYRISGLASIAASRLCTASQIVQRRLLVPKVLWQLWERLPTFSQMIRTAVNQMLRRAGARYIAGPELSDAIAVCVKLSRDSFASTLGFWDSGNDSPQCVAQEYLNGIEAASRQPTDCYVSIKLTALGFDHTAEDAVLSAAAKKNVRIHFDSQAPNLAGWTLSLLQDRIRRTGSDPQMLGCTLPGRWRRSVQDAESVIRMGVCVRVVKGQWEDDEGPEIDIRTGFLNVIDRLSGHAAYVSVATHDAGLAREAIHRLRSTNTACDLELLLGLPARHMLKLASSVSAPVRFYIPYGHAWLPYALGQVKRNPRILYWIAKDLLTRSDSRY